MQFPFCEGNQSRKPLPSLTRRMTDTSLSSISLLMYVRDAEKKCMDRNSLMNC